MSAGDCCVYFLQIKIHSLIASPEKKMFIKDGIATIQKWYSVLKHWRVEFADDL